MSILPKLRTPSALVSLLAILLVGAGCGEPGLPSGLGVPPGGSGSGSAGAGAAGGAAGVPAVVAVDSNVTDLLFIVQPTSGRQITLLVSDPQGSTPVDAVTIVEDRGSAQSTFQAPSFGGAFPIVGVLPMARGLAFVLDRDPPAGTTYTVRGVLGQPPARVTVGQPTGPFATTMIAPVTSAGATSLTSTQRPVSFRWQNAFSGHSWQLLLVLQYTGQGGFQRVGNQVLYIATSLFWPQIELAALLDPAAAELQDGSTQAALHLADPSLDPGVHDFAWTVVALDQQGFSIDGTDAIFAAFTTP